MGSQFKPVIKSLIILHTAMLFIQIVFAGIVYGISMQTKPSINENLSRILQTAAVVLTLGGGTVAFVLFKKKISVLQETRNGFTEKINDYRTASIIKYALLETPSLFCIIGYFLTQNISFLLLCVVLILVFAGQKPTVNMMMYDMNVSRDELFE